MYRNLFSGDVFAEMDRLQRQLQQAFDLNSPSIRGFAGGFPAVNVGQTPSATEIYAFVPGVDPDKIDVTLDQGVLSISGERTSPVAGGNAETTLHSNERFDGSFRRTLSLSDDSDANGVTAECRDGVLHIRVKRNEAAQPRRIEIQ